MAISLKPCPKCGGKAKLNKRNAAECKNKIGFALVRCMACGFKTPTFRAGVERPYLELRQEAIDYWNNISRKES